MSSASLRLKSSEPVCARSQGIRPERGAAGVHPAQSPAAREYTRTVPGWPVEETCSVMKMIAALAVGHLGAIVEGGIFIGLAREDHSQALPFE